MRKGQAALEFLMTYGWAILVVLAAIAALAYFGVLSPDKFLPAKYTVSGGFSAGQYKVTQGTPGVIQLEVQNNLGSDVTSYSVFLDMTGCGGPSVVGADTQTFPAGLGNGKLSGLLSFTCTSALSANDKFKGDVRVVYTKTGETVTHTAGGSLSGNAEQ